MNRRTKFLAAGVTAVAVAAGGAGLAVAGSGDDDTGDSEVPITGSELEQAKAVALDEVGEGKVTETEVGDEESYYEVGITLDDGSETDVHLDRGFNVVASESDGGGSEANDD